MKIMIKMLSLAATATLFGLCFFRRTGQRTGNAHLDFGCR